jgi:hypothetical protein
MDAKKRKRKSRKKNPRHAGKFLKVIVKKNGSMITPFGQKVTWNEIHPNAEFIHHKK